MRLRVPLVLASQSPRRRELLAEAGLSFEIATADDVAEAHTPALSPPELTCHNARLKAVAAATRYPGALVLGADTLVYLDGEPLGKPASLEEAAAMLARLAGRTHQVCTGVCLAGPEPGQLKEFYDLTDVTFHPLTAEDIQAYLRLVPVLDKAGAYAAQDHGEHIIARLDGSRSNVIGLPMEKTLAALAEWAADS